MKRNEAYGLFAKLSKGFTLLELVVVIFIIALFAALVFPSFTKQGKDSLRYDAGKMASLLRYLNESAVSSKHTFSLKFELVERRISWDGPDGKKSEEMETLRSVRLQSRGEMKDGEVTIFFGPLGLQENIEVRFSDNDKDVKVVMNAVSGRAKIVTGDE